MSKSENSVFISYRRTNIGFALAIYQNLTQYGYDVFFDYASINSGDFEQIIIENIKSRPHFIVILTPSALERCNEPGDWFRREIETAMEHNRNIIPMTFEGFDWDLAREKYLTGRLVAFSNYNELPVPIPYFMEALERLRTRYMSKPLEMILHPLSPKAEQAAEKLKQQADSQPLVTDEVLSAEEWFEQGYQYSEKGIHAEAIKAYNKALQLKPDFAAAYNNRGLAKRNLEDYKGAIADFDAAIQFNPGNLVAHYNRGIARYKQKQYKEAIIDFDVAIRLNPDNSVAYYNRGIAKYKSRDYSGAITDFDESIRLNGGHARAYFNRANAKFEQMNYADAILDYSKSIELDANYFISYNNRANAKLKLDDIDGAIADYTEAIRHNTNYATAYMNRGNAKRHQNDTVGAIADYNQAILLNPDYAQAYHNRGITKRSIEDFAGAIEDYTKAIDLGLADAAVYNNRGNARYKLRDYARAIEDYEMALQLEPDHELAQESLIYTQKKLDESNSNPI